MQSLNFNFQPPIPFINEDGYRFEKIFKFESSPKEAIYFERKMTEEEIQYVINHNIDKMVIDGTKEKEMSFSFLSRLPSLRYLVIYGDIEAQFLYPLNNLKYLHVSSKNEIDLHKFPLLEWLSTSSPNKIQNLGKARQLKSVSIYNGPETCKDDFFVQLSHLENIDTLILDHTQIKNVDFVKGLKKLQVLVLKDNKSLKDIESITFVKNTLKCLKIILSPKIESFDTFKQMSKLVCLYIDTCHSLPNVEFISEMKNLDTAVVVNTRILDGNLSSFLSLSHGIVFPLKKDYYTLIDGDRKPFSLDLFPYSKQNQGNDEVEKWRRISTW